MTYRIQFWGEKHQLCPETIEEEFACPNFYHKNGYQQIPDVCVYYSQENNAIVYDLLRSSTEIIALEVALTELCLKECNIFVLWSFDLQ